jgi:hypothetical protein
MPGEEEEEDAISISSSTHETKKWRRHLSTIAEPSSLRTTRPHTTGDYQQQQSGEGDDSSSIDSKERYWGNGAPLGRGPMFEQDDHSIEENEEELVKRFAEEMAVSASEESPLSAAQREGREGGGSRKSSSRSSSRTTRRDTKAAASVALSPSASPSVRDAGSSSSKQSSRRSTAVKRSSPSQLSPAPAPSSSGPGSASRQSSRKPRSTLLTPPQSPAVGTAVAATGTGSSLTSPSIRQTFVHSTTTARGTTRGSRDSSMDKGSGSSRVTRHSATPGGGLGSADGPPLRSSPKPPSQLLLIEDDDEEEEEEEGGGGDDNQSFTSDVSDVTAPAELTDRLSPHSHNRYSSQAPSLLHIHTTAAPEGSSSHVSSVRSNATAGNDLDQDHATFNPVSSVSVTFSQSKNDRYSPPSPLPSLTLLSLRPLSLHGQPSVPLPPYGGQAMFLDGKWTVIPKKHNHILPPSTTAASRPPSATVSSVPMATTPSLSQALALAPAAPGTAGGNHSLSPLRSPMRSAPSSPQQAVSTPQKGISAISEKTGRGGLRPKRNLEVRPSFHEEEGELGDPSRDRDWGMDDDDEEGKELTVPGYTHWRNDFFLRPTTQEEGSNHLRYPLLDLSFAPPHPFPPPLPSAEMSPQEEEGASSFRSPESLKILQSYESKFKATAAAPGTAASASSPTAAASTTSVPAHIPIMKRSYFNRSMEPPVTQTPTLTDFIEVPLPPPVFLTLPPPSRRNCST